MVTGSANPPRELGSLALEDGKRFALAFGEYLKLQKSRLEKSNARRRYVELVFSWDATSLLEYLRCSTRHGTFTCLLRGRIPEPAQMTARCQELLRPDIVDKGTKKRDMTTL